MTLAGRVYTVGDLGAVNVSARNGASVQLTVGNVRRDPVDPGNRGQGYVVLGAADATISARTGDVAQIEIGGARSSISADARSASGFNVGSFFSATESLIVDLTVAQYTTAGPNTSAVVQGNALGTVRLHGDRPRGLFFFQNNNTTLQVGAVSGNVTIDRNTLPQKLDQVGVSSIGGNLAITSNRGFTDAAATAWASQRSIGGSLTVSGNQP